MNISNLGDKLPLPVATPESVGIPSGSILNILKELNDKRLPMHSFLVLRYGKLVSENYWKPYHRDRKHRIYSISKSLTSLAVGIMADEGKLSLDDKVVKYFPEYLPADANEFLTSAIIRDMLKMADNHPDMTYDFENKEWLKTWFETPATHPAGAVYTYNTCCTNLCCAIVEKLSGMTFIEYLYPRLLGPVGMSEDITCIKTPDGYSFGGSGVLATPMDLALMAQVCMNKGNWHGKQLISEKYINEATSSQIDNSVTGTTIDEQQGYGYQFWRTRHNGYACYGMGSQYTICLPDQDLVVVTTADTQGITNAGYIIHESIFSLLLPALNERPLEENISSKKELDTYSSSLELPLVPGKIKSPIVEHVSGKTYVFNENPLNIKKVCFEFSDSKVVMNYEKPDGIYKLSFGIGNLIKQSFPETHYSGSQIGIPAGYGYECHADAAWSFDNNLRAKVYITDDYLGSFSMNAVFNGNDLTIIMSKIAEDFLHDYQGTATGKSE